jgi:hypothetical protein
VIRETIYVWFYGIATPPFNKMLSNVEREVLVILVEKCTVAVKLYMLRGFSNGVFMLLVPI